MSARLAPTITQDTQFFWDGVASRRLLIQQCAGCGLLRHPPRPMCPTCRSLQWEAIESTGIGTVYSFVMPHHPPLPGFENTFIVAIVELEEGTRLVTNLVDVEPEAVTIGMPVVVRYDQFDDGLVLPMFTPAPRS